MILLGAPYWYHFIYYINETGTVIYRSKMSHGNNSKKNFEVYTAEEFIAAISQHIPEKSFQMVYATMDGIKINSNDNDISTSAS